MARDDESDARRTPSSSSAAVMTDECVSDLDHLVFSLHALDRMTQRGIRVAEVQRAFDQDGPTSYDLDGNHRYDAHVTGVASAL